jgi:MYXO-CTERM domain-containing protein
LRFVLAIAVFLIWTPVAHAWSWPVHGPVLEPYAYDEANPYASGQHRGVDIGADAAGESVVAPAAGTVSFAGTVPTSGKSVTIETADGYSVTLTHLGTILVARGAIVAEQEPVGTIGPSGTPEIDAPYVHLGIRLTADPNGYVDPLGLLPPPAESGASQSDVPTTQPSTSTGSAATTPQPASAPASAPVPTTRGSTVTPSAAGHSQHARARTQRARADVQAQRPASRPAIARPTAQHRARTPHRHLSRPVTSSQRPVVETAAHPEARGLDAGHQRRPSADTTAQRWSSPRGTPSVPIPLVCNGAAALVALAAAFAAARRRRRDTSLSASAQVLQLPCPALGRHERRAA